MVVVAAAHSREDLKLKSIIIFSTAIWLATGAVSFAEQAPLTIYRDLAGNLTAESKEAAKDIRRIAQRQGYVTLWLTLNYEIDLYLDETTQQAEIAAQNQAIRGAFEEILSPMAHQGAIWYPEAGPYFQGPGTVIRANVAGLRRLIRDERIIQIVGME